MSSISPGGMFPIPGQEPYQGINSHSAVVAKLARAFTDRRILTPIDRLVARLIFNELSPSEQSFILSVSGRHGITPEEINFILFRPEEAPPSW